jgi:NAD(P)-dependent dehydrogenase (short-subunit alcohol dehydrogenase family)
MANVVITGSTRGVGLAMAKEFLKKGCNVTISGRAQIPSAELEIDISGFKSKVLYVGCDVRNKNELENNKNNAQIAWLTNLKVIWRFLTVTFKKRQLI